ncbi:CPBP family intramembrane metalloprotease [Nodosilinea sp. LEGE 07088]|uniref:CPBP family intramembrane glutamic endopeptidase n=1 Tax=Nodosilinea sp. LEGE 07088 TaxID=2777968 RepID=UPI00187DE706|nr:CPBP family intramembrane glutamic endopeptidase [Nodosilinea sp. LEGE 07088]MBE9136474.1 CPBP family intramembrane metalloprotease [Nodosilinea sp. LEGE 07088]
MVKHKDSRLRLFGLLWLAGMAGVISLVLLPLPSLPEGAPPAAVVRLLVLVQPTILLSVAVLIGVLLAHRLGLTAPGAEALSTGRSWRKAMVPQLLPGVVGGLISGGLLAAIALLSRPLLPSAYGESEPTPLLVRFLYGGITEEILIRWGLMTLLLWLGWRFGQQRQGKPQDQWVVIAIAVSSLGFAMAHLPAAIALGLPLTPALLGFLLLQNSLFAVAAGYLFWRYGLEAAIIAHLTVHAMLALIG